MLRLPSRRPALTDLSSPRHTLPDELAITLSRFTRTIPAAFALLFTLLLAAHVSTLQRALLPPSPPPRPTLPFRARAHVPPFAPVAPRPPSARARARYARLATLYLSRFVATNRTHLPAALASCTSCFLLQVRNAVVYVHDPHFVRVDTNFRVLRMREALHWVRSAVERGVADDFDMLIAVSDFVPHTSANHSYLMPPPANLDFPVFSVSRCNVSTAIPFPMVQADVLRRGFGERFGKRESGLLKEWDRTMLRVGKVNVPWHQKQGKAVFRGSVRMSAAVGTEDKFHDKCDQVGRTGLWVRAREHWAEVHRVEKLDAQRRTTWPLPWSWFVSRRPRLLDVQIAGVCGKRIYVSDGMSMLEQGQFKYVIHAEGNSFWADRLLVLLFGSSAVLKQETPCGMFFEPLLEPYKEYIPVDYEFRHLVRQTIWARQNDGKVREIVSNARRFAEEYLSISGVQTYVDELLVQYASVMPAKDTEIQRGAVQLFP